MHLSVPSRCCPSSSVLSSEYIVARIQDRIFTLDTELEYQISDSVSVGAGYRFQQFINGVQLDPIELNETVHTIRALFSIDFAAAYAAIATSD